MNELEKLKEEIWVGLGTNAKGQFLKRKRLHNIIDTAYKLGQQSNLPKADVVAVVSGRADQDEASAAADEYINVLEEFWGIPDRYMIYPKTANARQKYQAARANKK